MIDSGSSVRTACATNQFWHSIARDPHEPGGPSKGIDEMGTPSAANSEANSPFGSSPTEIHQINSPSLAAVLGLALLLCWPAIYNGFPLVFSDTGTYIVSGIERFIPQDRPVFYGGLIAAASSFGGLTIVALLQSACVAYVTLLFFEWAAPQAPRTAKGLTLACIALLTPAAWLSSWLMPDVFGGLIVLIALLLTLAFDKLGLAQRAWLTVLLALTLIVHTGNLLFFAGLLFLMLAIGSWARQRLQWPGITLATLVWATSVFASMLPNRIAHDRWTINPGSQAFMAARLVGDGLMKTYLERHCPTTPDLPLCQELDQLSGMTNNDFLWSQPSLASLTGAWDRNAVAYQALNAAVIKENAGTVARAAAANTLALLGRTQIAADPIDQNFASFASTNTSAGHSIAKLFPGEHPRFLAARQQAEQLHLGMLNTVHAWWTWASYVLLAIAALAAQRTGNTKALVIIGVIAASLILNAAVHGSLSGVYSRYQVKVTWLATLAALASLNAMWGSFSWLPYRRVPSR